MVQLIMEQKGNKSSWTLSPRVRSTCTKSQSNLEGIRASMDTLADFHNLKLNTVSPDESIAYVP